MALRLIIEDEEGATTIVPLGEEEVTIGREPGNTIQLTEQNVSRQHARLSQGSDGWVIEDLDSYNGVKVNGVPVEGSVSLNEGDVVQIGDYHLALSNNVEQTTLNIDRPSQAANEPGRATPSVDLPRMSSADAAALTTPGFSAAQDDEPEQKGVSRGLVIGLVVLLLAGVGIAYKMMGPGTAKPTADPGVVTKTSDSATPEPVPTPSPEPQTPPVEAEAEAEADNAGEQPSNDEDAVPEDPPVAPEPITKKKDPAIKPPPVTKMPATEPKPKSDAPKGDPVALLEDARKAVVANNATQAYELARKSYDINHNVAALKIMGVSACKMGDINKAKAAFKKLDASLQKQMQSVCAERGISLP